MKKKFNLFIIITITGLMMILGLVWSFWGIYHEHVLITYLGLAMIGIASFTWWSWVVITINKALFYTERTVNRAEQLKEEIIEVKILLRNYKFGLLDRIDHKMTN
jgi:hypothetical protein